MGIYLVDGRSLGLGSRFHLNHFDIYYLPKDEARTKALEESSQKSGRSVGER